MRAGGTTRRATTPLGTETYRERRGPFEALGIPPVGYPWTPFKGGFYPLGARRWTLAGAAGKL